MQDASIVDDKHRRPLQTLLELAEMRFGNRPFCGFMTSQLQFIPKIWTPIPGREISCTSFLAPFLSVSVFDEDEPLIAEKFFSGNSHTDKSVNHTLQVSCFTMINNCS